MARDTQVICNCPTGLTEMPLVTQPYDLPPPVNAQGQTSHILHRGLAGPHLIITFPYQQALLLTTSVSVVLIVILVN